MKTSLTRVLIALLCAPALAQAAYKCKQPNGSVSFQDQPCEAGATSSTLSLPPPSGDVGPPKDAAKAAGARVHPAQRQAGGSDKGDSERRRAEADVKAHNDQVEAYNKGVRCANARQQLGVLKAERPVYSRDNAGNKKYMEDNDRPAAIAAAEARVAAECGR